MSAFSIYYNNEAIQRIVQEGEHRKIIGGEWEEYGRNQLDFLKRHSLRPESRLLDIGCGSLRLGVPAVRYLAAGNYWGTDLSRPLLDAGYEKEIVPEGLADKLPRDHLVIDDDFTFPGLPTEFDFCIAQSVFTHLPLNHMRLCLAKLADHLTKPTTFFFTIFAAPNNTLHHPVEQCPGIVSHPHKDPYHYSISDLHHAAAGLPWRLDFIGEWGHPRNQKMARAVFDPSFKIPAA
ncbi:class I SAM-dependent methyltransferase [Mesorhizobium sp. CN5-321]|jgi:cyclopropane fatty-acyl-phospholipid synthase-like methyltransferase|uniref:class I SAM-dependent methyltransferase n=1 Tax=Mesorhizobium hunchu TaxID=3157708 RepID=UPI0032B7D75D